MGRRSHLLRPATCSHVLPGLLSREPCPDGRACREDRTPTEGGVDPVGRGTGRTGVAGAAPFDATGVSFAVPDHPGLRHRRLEQQRCRPTRFGTARGGAVTVRFVQHRIAEPGDLPRRGPRAVADDQAEAPVGRTPETTARPYARQPVRTVPAARSSSPRPPPGVQVRGPHTGPHAVSTAPPRTSA